jgi:serine protease
MKPSASGGSVYNFKQGTSMATPLVSAAVALMLSKDPTLTPAQVKSILSAPSSLTAFPSFGASSYPAQNNMDCTVGNNCGTGILNAKLALQNTPSNASGGGGSTTPTTTTTANRPTAKAPSSGGGGCAIMPAGATPDISLLLAMIAIAAYWLRRRVVREQSAD